jgi:2-polyprenyl-3-methyl-5-hydroxy-6-metoxy-1,4-benzoquinol methylase
MFDLPPFLRRHRFESWITQHEEPTLAEPVSQLCTEAQMAEPVYRYWCGVIREFPRKHRKQWEFCYILQALYRAGVMQADARGLGFGVGREPLAAVLAERGCHVIATDMDPKLAAQAGWTDTKQYAAESAQLNDRGICPPDLFVERVQFRVVDMTRVTNDLTGFDFVWSSCSLEHLGTLKRGTDFIWRSLECLRPGGIAVHTTEPQNTPQPPSWKRPIGSVYRHTSLSE